MAEIFINQADVDGAETFLVEYLTEKVPEANFASGSAIRDLAVKSFAHVYAYLRGEIDRISTYQSLDKIREAIVDEQDADDVGESLDVTQAVDEILSNWFLFRQQGNYARVTAILHFSRKETVVIQRDTKFWRTNSLAFYLDSTTDPYVVSSSSMLPVFDSKGGLVDYVVSVPLKGSLPGEEYNQPIGRFVRIETNGGLPFFSYAEQQEDAYGGSAIEASTDFMERAETAVTVRNLINNRSCDATLIDVFPEIRETLTVGMAEVEMIRDKLTEFATHIQLHVGGHYDTYVELPLERVEETGTVGGYFPRPDKIVKVFRDPELTHDGGAGSTFTELGVQAGHVLYLRSGITAVPQGFSIESVTAHEIYVSDKTPFPEASDELDVNAVSYSIGWFSPQFNQLDFDPGAGSLYVRTAARSTDPAHENVPAGTSRHVSSPGVVLLSGKPVQDIIAVEVTDPDAGDATQIDPSTGTIRFNNRVNLTPTAPSLPGTVEYQVLIPNYQKAQSAFATVQVNVGYFGDTSHFDGRNLKVTYQSLRLFSNVHSHITNPDVRVVSANHLAKARHPIWISVTIPYRLSRTAADTLGESAAAQLVSTYINEFDPNEDLDMSDISTYLRTQYPQIGAVFPFDIYYDLHSPDGQVIQFRTTDIVSIFPSATNGSELLLPSPLSVPPGLDIIVPDEMQAAGTVDIRTNTELQTYFRTMGISDRTVKYRTRADKITFVLQG